MDRQACCEDPQRGDDRALHAITAILRQVLGTRPEVVAVYLFGSLARGRARDDSDIDVAVLLAPDFDVDAHRLYRLDRANELASALRRPVDVVLLNVAPLVLRNQVLSYGQLVYETNRRQRVDYEVRSRQAYFDFRPILDRIYAALRRQLKEGTFGHQYRGHRDPLGDALRARERLDGPGAPEL
jgi:uncharacterized protein